MTFSTHSDAETAINAKLPIQEATNTNTAAGSTETLPDVTTATVHYLTLDANCTLTFPTAVAGKSFRLHLIQDGTGSRTVTWPASVRWANGNLAPTLTTTANRRDVFTFEGVDLGGGTVYWLGYWAGPNFTV